MNVTVEYDMIVVVKIYSFYLLRKIAIFFFVGAVLIRGCCLFKSLFYECNA